MKYRTLSIWTTAACLLIAAVLTSAQDPSADTTPRAMTAAEQAAPPAAKPAETKAPETKPAETKAAETKAAEPKPAENPADPRFSQIPDQAALVVKLNLNKLYSSATFKAVAESGDVLAIRNDLMQVPWTKDGALPDPILLYAPRLGSSYTLLVGTDRRGDELASLLKEKFAGKKQVESERTGLGEMITVSGERIDRKTKKKTMRTEAEILCLTPQVAAFGRKNNPLDLGFFASESLPASEFAKLRNLPAGVVAAGVMRSFPVPAAEDPTGLAQLVNTGEFTVVENAPGAVSAVLTLDCKGEKEAELAARRMKSFLRITLVSLFAADKTLFQELNKSCTTSSSGNTAKLEIKLTKANMDRVRTFYLIERTVLSVAADAATTVIKNVTGAK